MIYCISLQLILPRGPEFEAYLTVDGTGTALFDFGYLLRSEKLIQPSQQFSSGCSCQSENYRFSLSKDIEVINGRLWQDKKRPAILHRLYSLKKHEWTHILQRRPT